MIQDLSDIGMEVPVSGIEKELRNLWAQDEARTNASLMNLVIYSEKKGSLAENSAFIRCLTQDHACRAILVEIDRSIEEKSLRAWITTHCHLANGKKSICCEQVAFHLTGRVTGRFRNTVFSHLDSDLPLVFWWQGELSDIFTERLASVIDRLIVDSSSWEQPAATFDRLTEAMEASSKLILQDLAWTRTWQFRVGVAGLFDDPVAQAALPKMESIRIVHHPKHRNCALQLLAWLSIQAGWNPTAKPEKGATKFSFAAKGGEIAIVLEADPNSAALGELVMSAGETTVSLKCNKESGMVLRKIESPMYHASSVSPADPEPATELIALQLSRGGKNSLFKKILPRFRELLS
ncbi:glucose-6-phosphate dehydrogenase assembly protein OpcA [Luteolibacter pohnpeiensis]|uniref:Glucose-6-phosphate dehydrogenase assembly protein OpcA n=1 Tax=Luteolibacter pohnpeiensis TaxID=454153 RepID=A0A934S198_9BACT|nr:glucose-6-phosphate dehydrogenase assembly protein OpcA [Luteolibacter pohnpeiensis]MBK1881395.1 glucose-6-phosphate dehydrogenase assembly protein OpcA [Luteolibacter pohnpeiensis]